MDILAHKSTERITPYGPEGGLEQPAPDDGARPNEVAERLTKVEVVGEDGQIEGELWRVRIRIT